MLACGAAFDVLTHKLRETGPPEFRGDELASFKVSQVASSFMVMAAGKDGAMEGILWGNVDMTLIGQDMVIELPVREVRPEGSGDVLQGRLQVMEDEGVRLGRVTDVLMQFCVNEVDKEGVGEEDSRRVIQVVGVEIGAAGESIRSGKEAARDMDDFEVKISEVEQPPRLAAIEVLGLTEVRQVLVICEDLYGEGGTVEVVSPGLQGADDHEEFSVINVIVSFSGDERLREI